MLHLNLTGTVSDFVLTDLKHNNRNIIILQKAMQILYVVAFITTLTITCW
jgi:hypothetical protein